VRTDEEKLEFVKQYAEREGIVLDPKNINLNKGFRAITKYLLNALWGKVCLKNFKKFS